MRNENLKMLIVTALFAAIIGIMAQLTIPLPLVPITGQTLAIGLAATILGKRYGTLSVLVYIMLGIAGLPVFSAMTSGLGIVFGPTGGYIIGFIPAAFIIGWYLERFGFTVTHAIIANIMGTVVTLTFGAVWLKFIAELSWTAVLAGGVTPFIIVGIIKAVIAATVGIIVRKRLTSAKLLPVVIA
ncbi:biotin transporter BioY [Paenisporosarcina sp. TG-14]|uniref:biotin transporter BioY n=1 Tax=Paenisporosarcina sp. TG-14 TaxID=1231057 RepID=UPI0002DFA63F|nr:biotin transporter BioY [Paenisporosarcina sp. TG-14]